MSRAIGPGRVVLVVGPSGAGKDTLIRGARAALHGDGRFVFPRRKITRAVSDSEDHDSITASEFAQAAEDGLFALAWEAHGLRYGVPISIDDDVRAGRTVICNVSRTIIDPARQRYQRVLAIQVWAPADVLMQRLATREREGSDAIAARLARSDAIARGVRPDFTIDNSGRVQAATRELIAIVRRAHAETDFPAELLF